MTDLVLIHYGAMILIAVFAFVLSQAPLTEEQVKMRNRNLRRYGIGKRNSKTTK